MRRFLHQCTRAVVWLMIPLTFVGSVPRMGCICANGDHKLFCERHRQVSADGACVCCHGRDRSAAKADQQERLQSGSMSCCGTSCGRQGKSRGLTVGLECPCRPVLDVPQLLAQERADFGVDLAGQILPLPETAEPRSVMNAARDVSRNRDLPPPDLVLAHRVFLI